MFQSNIRILSVSSANIFKINSVSVFLEDHVLENLRKHVTLVHNVSQPGKNILAHQSYISYLFIYFIPIENQRDRITLSVNLFKV